MARSYNEIQHDIFAALAKWDVDHGPENDTNRPLVKELRELGAELYGFERDFNALQEVYGDAKVHFRDRGEMNPYAALDIAWDGHFGWSS